ncbi:hypothetical protein CWE13_08020 [Aliidiomarina shirensis]|uniref:Uncharacterized protein n=1 Tax=Aliidiomarina shirensis TaxID=1048642 RepID=A0A432WSP7_9GAMM|nr:hypothetical protein [Aliidiomarina shirensis]RUO36787.1 hypothetical protein CWE13_08020 [Aliidiomarina shirensis]
MKQILNHSSPKHWLLTSALGLLMIAPAAAQEEKPSLAEEMKACASISNAIERLVCFDDLVAALPTVTAEAADRGARGNAETRGKERAAEATSSALSARERAAQERAAAAERRAAEAEERLMQQQAEQRRAAAEAERRNAEAARNQPPSDKTYITINEAWQNARGLWRFRLDNGQEWHQTSSEGGVRYREGMNYYIEPGSFGSYFLSSDDNNRRMRIRLVD